MGALLIGGCRTASGTPSRGVSGKGWRLSEGLREKIVSLATEDAARGVYMGEDLLRLRREEVQGVAPDRAALKRSFGEAAAAADRELLRVIKEGDRRMLCLLAGVPYQGELRPGGTGTALHIRDAGGEEILTYTAGTGWQEKPSRAENQVHGVIKAVYYEAWQTARQAAPVPAGGRGFDGKA